MATIETILSPALIPFHNLEGRSAVVIDILRATTSICHALDNGAVSMVPVSTPEECLLYRKKGYLCAAERNGLQLDGFDMGNSPEGFAKEVVAGKDIAITTTNGTFALLESRDAARHFIGSFLNMAALAKVLIDANEDVVMVCAGWKNKVNLEDSLFAGALSELLLEAGFTTDCDSTLMCVDLWKDGKSDLDQSLRRASHARRFEKLGIDDLPFCLQMNTQQTVQEYVGGRIITL
ncbi:MAG: 2-phosphosulfolactate phosphatase [Bacteroidetes bacterium]|nr:MAG: 2-phosphosulfolactate phosphatase [Bacteroidota bacterium]